MSLRSWLRQHLHIHDRKGPFRSCGRCWIEWLEVATDGHYGKSKTTDEMRASINKAFGLGTNLEQIGEHEPVTLVGGEKILAHPVKHCVFQDRPCCIHRPSQHHMVTWRQHWRGDVGKMERLCSHGVGHPDPDDLYETLIHGCDGCCKPPEVA